MTTHQFSRRLDSTEKITYTYEGETYENYMGNYWGDYMGNDGDGNGIGDTPYGINGDFDYHPLMNPLRITLRRRCPGIKSRFPQTRKNTELAT